MAGGTYKLINLVGTSNRSFADAAKGAIKEASRTIRGISWFEVVELTGRVEEGKVAEYQTTIRAGFKVSRGEALGEERLARAAGVAMTARSGAAAKAAPARKPAAKRPAKGRGRKSRR